MTLCVIACKAFFLPRLAERDQKVFAIEVFFDLVIAHANSHRADFICGFP